MTIKISQVPDSDGYTLSIDFDGYLRKNKKIRYTISDADIIPLLMNIGKSYEERITELANQCYEQSESLGTLEGNMQWLQAEYRKMDAKLAEIKKITA